MKKIVALVLALAMMLSLVSIASAEETKEIKLFLGGGTPLSMDPALNSASAGSNIIRSAFAGLMGYQLNAEGEPEMKPELAETVEVSDDGLVYTFTLREGLKWSDGTDATATQIKAAWDRAASPELGADYGFLFDVISRADDGKLAIDVDDAARTFVVHLPQPCAYFLDLCAFVPFYPVRVDLADNEGVWATKPETFIGLGAFNMVEYSVDDKIVFVKNPYYWNAENVKLDGITFYLSEDNTAILTAYENNTVDYIQSISSSEYDRLNATYPGELEFFPTQGTWYILFNVYKDLSPASKQLTVPEQSKARFALGELINRYEKEIGRNFSVDSLAAINAGVKVGFTELDEYGTPRLNSVLLKTGSSGVFALALLLNAMYGNEEVLGGHGVFPLSYDPLYSAAEYDKASKIDSTPDYYTITVEEFKQMVKFYNKDLTYEKLYEYVKGYSAASSVIERRNIQ